MTTTPDTELAQYVLNVIRAIKMDILKVRTEDAAVVAELMAAPRGVLGMVDVKKLSARAQSFARMAGMGLAHLESMTNNPSHSAAPESAASSLAVQDIQVELFRLFSVLFTALTGTGVISIANKEEIRNRLISKFKNEGQNFAQQLNSSVEELEEFYKKNSRLLFLHAKGLGGVKLLTGGQRAFGESAFNGVRITGLYADTQLIPDPVYPYLTGDMHLNAAHLQLAHSLYYILQLQPLVDARLPTPPVFIFPSFELELESGDAVTQLGLSELALRLVAPVCSGTFESIEDLTEYANKHEEQFINAVMRERLFVYQGGNPSEQMSGSEALKRHLAALEGVRDAGTLAQMRKTPAGILIMFGVIERLLPQYHLLENSTELNAQPLLSQEVHWHYYEKCAQATARSLVNHQILSESSFQTLRALHDEKLGWLANIPIEGLVELNRAQEHKVFRKELKDYTTQLASAGSADLNHVVREVNHALADLVQRQQKNLRDIEDKYAPKKWGTYVGGALTVGTAASALMLPSLAPLLGLSAPAIATAAGIAGTAVGYGKEKAGELIEKHRSSKTMLGMLAIARPK